jgi:hypothetical protein
VLIDDRRRQRPRLQFDSGGHMQWLLRREHACMGGGHQSRAAVAVGETGVEVVKELA